MRAYWARSPRPGNVGDLLTPWFMQRAGVVPEYAPPSERGKVIGAGSTARFARAGDQVWGAGMLSRKDQLCADALWLAVRGPITRDALRTRGADARVIGDPALLSPRLFHPEIDKQFAVGYVPHYRDVAAWKRDKLSPLISPLTDVDGFITDLLACERIVSSSLHGLILAHAYGLPATQVRSTRLAGDGVKFDDYFASIGGINPGSPDLQIDREALWRAAPWHWGGGFAPIT